MILCNLKVIISACSPFFRNVLRQNPHQHPLLYMRGVNFTDLQSVLTFMYQGEVRYSPQYCILRIIIH